MVEVNKDELTVEVKETLSFDYYAIKEAYSDAIDEVKCNLENDFYANNKEKSDAERFVNYELTHEDKVDILQKIADNYEENVEWGTESLFDEDTIKNCIREWICDNFGELFSAYPLI